MVLNRFHISRLRLHFEMILQVRDIQQEPSEKVRRPDFFFEYVSDSLFFIPENKARAHSVGPLFHKAGEHFVCRMSLSKGCSKFRASFPNLGRTKQGVDIENICHHLWAIGQTKRIQCWQSLWQKRHPFWGHFALKELASHWEHLSEKHQFWGHFPL